jgi:hypothetical protein
MGSNPTQGMDVFQRLFYVCVCVLRPRDGLILPSKGSYRLSKIKIHRCPVIRVGAARIDR